MAIRKKPTGGLDPDVVIDVGKAQVLSLTRDRLLELAASWEREADEIDRHDPGPGSGNMLQDLIVGAVGGVADGSRSIVLRECARELRLLAGEK